MSTKSHVCLGAQYRNPDARSSGKAVDSRANSRRATSVHLAAQIARRLALVRTWSNLQTIRLAIESEADLSDISVAEAARVILDAARELSYGPSFRPPAEWEHREIFRENSVDRFWFEDARWRTKGSYLVFVADLRKQRGEMESTQ